MRIPKMLSLINGIAAATLLIVLAVTTDSGGQRGVTLQMIAEASKNTSPEMGLDLLAQGINQMQRRANIVKWLCYGTLPLLAVNAFCWATWRGQRPAD